MTHPVPYATQALKDDVPDDMSPSGLITNTTSNALRALMDNPAAVSTPAPSASDTAEAANPMKGAPNPYGLGITAYEPNTSPFIHQLADARTGPGSTTLDGFEQDYASASADVDASMKQASDIAAARSVAPTGDFASGGVVDAHGQVAAFINAALSAASQNVPYVWGGTNLRSGVDCSGLIYAAAQAAGIKDWRRYAAADYGRMPTVSAASARPGDIVYWAPGADGVGPTGHVGIYLGNGKMVAAPQSGETVHVESVFGTPTYHRIFNDSSFGTVTTPSGGYTYNYNGRANPWANAAGQAVTASRVATSLGIRPPPLISDQASFTAEEHGDRVLPPGYVPESHYSAPASTLKTTVPYGSQFSAAGRKYGVPATLLAAVAQHESSFRPNAHSSAGAVGLMQFMPATARGLGVNPLDPASSIDGAARMLLGLYHQFGSWTKALWAYNAGSGNVRAGRVPQSTVQYAQNVLATAAEYGG